MLDNYFTKEQIIKIKDNTDYNDQLNDESSLGDYLYTIIWVLWSEVEWKKLNFPFDIRQLQKNDIDLDHDKVDEFVNSLPDNDKIGYILYLIDNN